MLSISYGFTLKISLCHDFSPTPTTSQLFNGSFANIMRQFGVDGLRTRMDKFFMRVSISYM